MPDESSADKELVKSPEEEIKGMGRKILGVIDGIIEEHGWRRYNLPVSELWAARKAGEPDLQDLGRFNMMISPLALGRRYDPQNFGDNFQKEAYCMAQVLEKGMIPRIQLPNQQVPLPRGILVNFRGAPEFYLSDWWNKEGVYRERSYAIVEEFLRKLGFLERLHEIFSERKTYHKYVPGLQTGQYQDVEQTFEAIFGPWSDKPQVGGYVSSDPNRIFDYSWITKSGWVGCAFIEMQHPDLPFVADAILETGNEPPVVFIRYVYPAGLEEEQQGALAEAEALFRGTRSAPLPTDEQLQAQNKEILLKREEIVTKVKTVEELISKYPKRTLDSSMKGSDAEPEYMALFDKVLKIHEQGGFSYLYLVDQKPPLKFHYEFFKFKDLEQGESHPYTQGARTDNLMMLHSRDEIDQPWQSGTYYLDPDGVLCKLPDRNSLPDSPPPQLNDPKECDFILKALDTMIDQVST